MPIDPVQSIRVAANLAERFGVLMTPGSMKVAELELKIGEAQQLYPEIWRHLDDARIALAAQGRDVRAFDDLRRGELAQLGVTDTETTTSLDYAGLIMGQLGTVQFKSATFNEAGYRRALAACRALMAAMPEVDWKAVAHEEQRAAREAGSLHSAKWKGGAKLILIAAALIGFAIILKGVMTREEPRRVAERRRDPELDRLREVRMAELEEKYALTCDRAVLGQLIDLQEEAAGGATENRVSAPCTPKRVSCDPVKAAIATRLVTQLDLVIDTMDCQGVLVTRGGPFEQALAVVVTTRDKRVLRGVTSKDGTRDVIELGPAPGRLAGIGDLDRDSGEELAFVDTTSVTITRIRASGFEDIEGPPRACATAVTVEGGHLILDVPEAANGSSCLAPGRHRFALRGSSVSETR